MFNIMFICGRRLKTELLQSKIAAVFLQRNASNTVIHIPQRKNRGPLDILQALAGTVEFEPGSTEYRFQYGGIFDMSKLFMRVRIAMSMDSGRKAAKWVVAQNPKLFQHKNADPYIKAFAPPTIIDENTEVSEEILLAAINDVNVESAIKLYDMMVKKDIDVSMATKQLLLEIVCYFNEENKPDVTLVETRNFEDLEKVNVNEWKKNGFAEKLFSEMEPNAESYSALILGMFKYNSIRSAMAMYDEAKEKGIELGVDVYNALLEHSSEEAFEYADQEKYIVKLLTEMKMKNIEPNLGTLNSTLKSIAAMNKWIKRRSFAVKVYKEFLVIGIKPSLATYYYMLEIFSDRDNLETAVTEILEEVESVQFVPKHIDDFKFFNKAMDVAGYIYRSPFLMDRVHELLMFGNNRYFLSGNLSQTKYYRTYIIQNFRYGKTKVAVNMLEKFSTQAYVPEVSGVLAILNTLEKREESDLILRIWPLIKGVVLMSEKLKAYLVFLLAGRMKIKKDDDLVKTAEEIWESWNKQREVKEISASLTSFLKVFALGGDKALSDEVFMKALTFEKTPVALDFESLVLYIDLCISKNDKEKALACVEFAVILKYEDIDLLLGKVKSKFDLKDEVNFIDSLKQNKIGIFSNSQLNTTSVS